VFGVKDQNSISRPFIEARSTDLTEYKTLCIQNSGATGSNVCIGYIEDLTSFMGDNKLGVVGDIKVSNKINCTTDLYRDITTTPYASAGNNDIINHIPLFPTDNHTVYSCYAYIEQTGTNGTTGAIRFIIEDDDGNELGSTTQNTDITGRLQIGSNNMVYPENAEYLIIRNRVTGDYSCGGTLETCVISLQK
jgi:hypothetical protein